MAQGSPLFRWTASGAWCRAVRSGRWAGSAAGAGGAWLLERVGQLDQLGSLQARPKNEMPTGRPKTNPAGTVMCG